MIFEFFLRRVLRCVQIMFFCDFVRFCVSFGLPLGSIGVPLASQDLTKLGQTRDEGPKGAPGSASGTFLAPFWEDIGGIWEPYWHPGYPPGSNF